MNITEEIINFGTKIGSDSKRDFYLYRGAIHEIVYEDIHSDIPMMTLSYSEGTVCFERLMEKFS